VMAIRCSDTLTMPAGERRADALIGPIPDQGLAGDLCRGGVHGPREFDWARVPVRPGWKRGREYWLLARRSISDPDEIAYTPATGRAAPAPRTWRGSRAAGGISSPGLVHWRRRHQHRARTSHYQRRQGQVSRSAAGVLSVNGTIGPDMSDTGQCHA